MDGLPRRGGVRIAISLVALVAQSCGGGPSDEATTAANFRAPGVIAIVPDDWSATRRPLSRLIDPHQMMTAGSFELDGIASKGGCYPAAALNRMPADGALVVVTRYGLGGRQSLRRLSRRPNSFALGPRTYNNFDCGGRKYNLDFREGSRGYRIEVWLDRRAAEPQVLSDTRALINSLEFPSTE